RRVRVATRSGWLVEVESRGGCGRPNGQGLLPAAPEQTRITLISTFLNLTAEMTIIGVFRAAGCSVSRDGRPNGLEVHPRDAFRRAAAERRAACCDARGVDVELLQAA